MVVAVHPGECVGCPVRGATNGGVPSGQDVASSQLGGTSRPDCKAFVFYGGWETGQQSEGVTKLIVIGPAANGGGGVLLVYLASPTQLLVIENDDLAHSQSVGKLVEGSIYLRECNAPGDEFLHGKLPLSPELSVYGDVS